MTNGEVCDNCQPILTALHDRNVGLQRTLNSQAGLLGKATREDPSKRARDHAQWDRCARLFKLWQRATGHTRSRFTTDRFLTALPLLEEYEDNVIERAIEGIAFDPFVTRRRNGTEQRHDDWNLLFKSAGKLEEFANRSPLDWKDTLEGHMAEVDGRK